MTRWTFGAVLSRAGATGSHVMRMRNPCAGLMAAVVWFASASAHAQCTKDTDCKGLRVCDAGQCTGPAPSEDTEERKDSPPPEAAAAPVERAPASAKVTEASSKPELDEPAPRETAMRARSTPLVIAGSVALSLSSIGLYVTYGASIIGVFGNRSHYDRLEREEARNIAIGFGVGTVVLMAVGIPMIVIGSKRVPDTTDAGASRPSNLAHATLVPWAGRDGGGLTLRAPL